MRRRAESAFTMPYPAELGPIPARAFDEAGRALPIARLAMEGIDGDRVAIRFEAGEADGARMDAHALLGPAGEDGRLRLLAQHSLSTDPSGRPLRAVEVDHEARRARCYGPDGAVVDEVALEPHDRVVNVPMNLFFLPLVRGEQERLEFELFLCRTGAQRVPHLWRGHRLPLYTEGPEVLVVREDGGRIRSDD